MKFHYAGKFDGDETKLPHREHPVGSVPFREPDMKQLALIANAGGFAVMIVCCIVLMIRALPCLPDNSMKLIAELYLGIAASLLVLFPHELLHGICFREDVYLYTYLQKGMIFVVGPEDMSKGRFIFMSLLPNLVFGAVPYAIGLIFPRLVGLGFFGAVCLGMGFGDYINVFNGITQVPKNAKVYLSGFHSFWYLPKQ